MITISDVIGWIVAFVLWELGAKLWKDYKYKRFFRELKLNEGVWLTDDKGNKWMITHQEPEAPPRKENNDE